MNIKLKLIAAVLTTTVAVLGVTQIAGAQKTGTATVASAQASTVDTPEAGDAADVAGATDTAEVGDTPDAAGDTETADSAETSEPAGADTDNVQQGDQSGPETPDAPGAASK